MTHIPTDIFLDLPTHRAHLIDWGGPIDAPHILLLHSAASNAKMWNLIAPKLAQKFRVMALDQRSHGLSGVPSDNDFSYAAVCGDLRLVCDHLQINRPIMVGHAWGAYTALEYAVRHADTAAVVLVEGGFVGANKVVTWPQFEQRWTPPRWIGTPLIEYLERIDRFRDNGDHYSADALAEIMGNIEVRPDQTVVPHPAFDNYMRILRAIWEQDVAVYEQVKCPAQFLWCLPPEPHDSFTQQSLGWKRNMVIPQIQTAMPQAQIEWLTDSMHELPLQHPDLIAERIRAFAAAI